MSQNNLDTWKQKIREKRKNTPFRQYLKEVASWKPFSFYKNSGMITRYAPEGRVKNIVSIKKFTEIRDNLPKKNYDNEKDFFDNFSSLFFDIPFWNLIHFNTNENADYADAVFTGKNVYLSNTIGIDAENIYYSVLCYDKIVNIFNSFMVNNTSQNIYQSTAINNSYNIFYSKFISDSSDIWFSTNLIGCRECIFCDWLQNKKYHIENKEYSREEYETEKKNILKQKELFIDYFKKLTNKAINYGSKNSSGNAIYFCENLENGFFMSRLKDGKNVWCGHGSNGSNDFYDCFDTGVNSKDFYAVMGAGENCDNIYCSWEIAKCSHIFYSYFLESCSFCLGCVGLKNKHFCILNKQYSKEDWYKKADEIFASMEREKILWEFFPPSVNPFYFNDTIAYFFDDSFSQEEIKKDGYLWREEAIKVDIPEGAEVVYVNPPVLSDIPLIKGDCQSGVEFSENTPPTRSSLPPQSRGTEGEFLNSYQWFDSNGIWQINPEIMKKVIQDSTGNFYKIIKPEYDFLMKYALPVPELHWMERIKLCVKS